jgi:hypothetical protein
LEFDLKVDSKDELIYTVKVLSPILFLIITSIYWYKIIHEIILKKYFTSDSSLALSILLIVFFLGLADQIKFRVPDVKLVDIENYDALEFDKYLKRRKWYKIRRIIWLGLSLTIFVASIFLDKEVNIARIDTDQYIAVNRYNESFLLPEQIEFVKYRDEIIRHSEIKRYRGYNAYVARKWYVKQKEDAKYVDERNDIYKLAYDAKNIWKEGGLSLDDILGRELNLDEFEIYTRNGSFTMAILNGEYTCFVELRYDEKASEDYIIRELRALVDELELEEKILFEKEILKAMYFR